VQHFAAASEHHQQGPAASVSVARQNGTTLRHRAPDRREDRRGVLVQRCALSDGPASGRCAIRQQRRQCIRQWDWQSLLRPRASSGSDQVTAAVHTQLYLIMRQASSPCASVNAHICACRGRWQATSTSSRTGYIWRCCTRQHRRPAVTVRGRRCSSCMVPGMQRGAGRCPQTRLGPQNYLPTHAGPYNTRGA